MAQDELLTAEDVAERLNVHPSSVRKWLTTGDLRGVKLAGTRWRVPESALQEFMDHATAAAKAEVDSAVSR